MNQRSVALILIIIIIVVIVIFIIHVLSLKKTGLDEGKVMVKGSYTITVGQNTGYDKIGSYGPTPPKKVFYLNGVETPTIMLRRGFYYEFTNETNEPFYFSEDILGGEGAPRSIAKHLPSDFSGIADGILFFRVTDDLPSEFYYQSGKTKGMGGKVVISE